MDSNLVPSEQLSVGMDSNLIPLECQLSVGMDSNLVPSEQLSELVWILT